MNCVESPSSFIPVNCDNLTTTRGLHLPKIDDASPVFYQGASGNGITATMFEGIGGLGWAKQDLLGLGAES